MDNLEAARLLNEDIRGEHGAIILYLQAAYALEDAALAASLEGIARDEMRHYKWLAEEVIRLGGVPTLEREGRPAADGALTLLRQGIDRETGAVSQYHQHAEAIGDARIAALLQRIASDEEVHDHKLQKMIQLLESGVAEPEPPGGSLAELETGVPEAEAAEATPPAAAEALQQDVSLEYTTLLEYLQQSFVTPDCPLSKELQDQAITEMKHMGWIAEYLAEAGVRPALEHEPVAGSTDPVGILRSNIEMEARAEELYRRQLAEAGDPALRALLQRVMDHSVFHEMHFRHLLADREEARVAQPAPPPAGEGTFAQPGQRQRPAWTVGSLLGWKQE